MAARPVARRRVTQIRRALLAFLILSVVGISSLLWFGRMRQVEGSQPTTALASDLDEGQILSSEGYEITVETADQVLYRLKAERHVADQEGVSILEGVDMEMPRRRSGADGGSGGYRIAGNKAQVNVETKQVLIEGDVRVEGANGIALFSDWLELREGGNVLVSSKGTRFRQGEELIGRSRNFWLHLDEERLVLSGGVLITSTESAAVPMKLKAKSVRFHQKDRVIRAEGKVVLEHGDNHLEANRITLRMDEETNSLRQVRAVQQVNGSFSTRQEERITPHRVRIEGWGLKALFDEVHQEPLLVELEGRRSRRALLVAIDDLGAERKLEAQKITAGFRNGTLATTQATGGVLLEEREAEGSRPGADAPTTRTATAAFAKATFDGEGAIVRLDLNRDVRIQQGGMTATGDAGVMSFLVGRSILRGTPVEVTTAQGRVRAPNVDFAQNTGLLHATGGVRTQLEKGSGAGLGALPMTTSDEPIRVDSTEALLVGSEGEQFTFKGDVRAWQGKNLILADQLRGEQKSGTMTASGSVKTVWFSETTDSDAPDQPAPQPAVAEGVVDSGTKSEENVFTIDGSEPIEVTADLMRYNEADGQLLYSGNVSVLQAGRILSCQEMEVETATSAEGKTEAERLLCQGSARLLDPNFGRTIEGDRAVYHLDSSEVEFYGTPVILISPPSQANADSGKMTGKELRYRLEDGFFRLGHASDAISPVSIPEPPTSQDELP
jgi:lipopolysaccharide export system protein LptA